MGNSTIGIGSDAVRPGLSGAIVKKTAKIKRSQPAAAPTSITVGAAAGCDLLLI
jgi:hypothetical protein